MRTRRKAAQVVQTGLVHIGAHVVDGAALLVDFLERLYRLVLLLVLLLVLVLVLLLLVLVLVLILVLVNELPNVLGGTYYYYLYY